MSGQEWVNIQEALVYVFLPVVSLLFVAMTAASVAIGLGLALYAATQAD